MQQRAAKTTWILLMRDGCARVYESTRAGESIVPVHSFAGEPTSINTNASVCDEACLTTVATWLEEARLARRYELLKLIGDPARLRKLLARLPAGTRALVTAACSEDLSDTSVEEPAESIAVASCHQRSTSDQRSDMHDSSTSYVLLAALQFDDTGLRALREACRIAQRDSLAELHLVHAVAPSLLPEHDGESTAIDAQLARAPVKLREYVDRVCSGFSIKIVAHVRTGTPAEVILQSAADLNADMIVLGTHRRSGLEKLLLGSVAERVLHEAPCPVLIAAPKSFERRAQNSSIEPPCPDCVALRSDARDQHAWCERHSRSRLKPHVYAPSDRPPASVLPT